MGPKKSVTVPAASTEEPTTDDVEATAQSAIENDIHLEGLIYETPATVTLFTIF